MRDRTVARVRLENIVWDARDPRRLGRSWATALGADLITDEPDTVEARLRLTDGFFLDLCFQRVAALPTSPSRLQLVDPEGNPLRVSGDTGSPCTGPVAALRLDSADPDRDVVFWAEITGWVPSAGPHGAATLRHPSGVGPSLELRREPEPKRGKNRLHLDVRREARDDDLVERLPQRGATPLSGPGEHPWLVFADPSGNEFCVLAALAGSPDAT
jgi:hypothetical protein